MATRIGSVMGALLVLLSASPAAADPPPSCRSDFGKTACGYHCVAAFGQVACAKTPGGLCKADFGKVVCWDPPARVRRHPRPGGVAPTCDSAFGKIACGYHCVDAFGQVICAKTPEGVCASAYGKVVCWDPPRRRHGHRWGDRGDGDGPRPTCRAAFGKIACGYGCIADYGQVRCAETPLGVCQAAQGTITCFDAGGGRVPARGPAVPASRPAASRGRRQGSIVVVPGRSIGEVRLGMTQGEVLALGLRRHPRFPTMTIPYTVYYDAGGRVERVAVSLRYAGRPVIVEGKRLPANATFAEATAAIGGCHEAPPRLGGKAATCRGGVKVTAGSGAPGEVWIRIHRRR